MGELDSVQTKFSHPRDSGWYLGKAISTPLFLNESVLPILQKAVGWAVNGEKDYLSKNLGDILVNGFNALAFGKENCPFGFEIDMDQTVSIINNPERSAHREVTRKIKPKNVKNNIRVIESFSVQGFDEPKRIEEFITFVLGLQKEEEKPIIIYGALDCPAIVLAIELGKHDNLVFANALSKYRFLISYNLSKMVQGFIK